MSEIDSDFIPPFDATTFKRLEMLAGKKYKGWKEKRQYETGALDNPKEFIWFEHPKFQDYYPKQAIAEFARAAKKFGVDPATYVSLGISESGLGYKNPSNPARINYGVHGGNIWKMVGDGIISSLDRRGQSVEFGASYLAQQAKKYKTPIEAIQAYSGTGVKPYGKSKAELERHLGTSKFFGTPYEKTNFWRDKPQGERVLEVLSKVKQQKEISDYINELANLPYKVERKSW